MRKFIDGRVSCRFDLNVAVALFGATPNIEGEGGRDHSSGSSLSAKRRNRSGSMIAMRW